MPVWLLALPLKTKLIAAGIAVAVLVIAAGLGGWYIRGNFCNADVIKQLEADVAARDTQIDRLQTEVKNQNDAVKAAWEERQTKQTEIETLKEELEKSYAQTPANTACFTVDRLSIIARAREASNKLHAN